jgi:3-mercaptopyruvate sulfurtransferase SseA
MMLDPTDWTSRSAETISKLARARGLDPAHQVITYCLVGISASLALFALYVAGYRNLARYDACL